jgi:hypothetical protein
LTTSFPTSLDSFTDPTAGNALNSPSHAGQHTDKNDAVEALEAKVGIDGSAVTTSIDYKLANSVVLKTLVDAKGDIIAATAADTVARLAVGTNGQVLTADSAQGTGLGWTTPSSGSSWWDTIITKAADEGVAGTTLQDDDHFTFSILSNTFYEFEMSLIIVGPAAGDFGMLFVTTTGTLTGMYGGQGYSTGDVGTNQVVAIGTLSSWGTQGSGTYPYLVKIRGSFHNTAAATFKLQWAQAVSSGTTTLKAGSKLGYRVVA